MPTQRRFDEVKQRIISQYRCAAWMPADGGDERLAKIAALLIPIELTLKVIHANLEYGGRIDRVHLWPSLKELCAYAVAAMVKERRVGFVTAAGLSHVVRTANPAKHDPLSRMQASAESVMLAQLIEHSLFEFAFDERIPSIEEEEVPTLGDLPPGAFIDFVIEGVRDRLAPVINSDQMEVFDLISKPLIGGAADTVTLHRSTDFEQWDAFALPGWLEFRERISDLNAGETQEALASLALHVLADLVGFVRTESDYARGCGKWRALELVLSDVDLAIFAMCDHLGLDGLEVA